MSKPKEVMMVDLIAIFRTLDQLAPHERQEVMRYLERHQDTPAAEPPKQRIAGLGAKYGKTWMSDDFNDELPDEFWFGEDENEESVE
jgi:hypothetical protein